MRLYISKKTEGIKLPNTPMESKPEIKELLEVLKSITVLDGLNVSQALNTISRTSSRLKELIANQLKEKREDEEHQQAIQTWINANAVSWKDLTLTFVQDGVLQDSDIHTCVCPPSEECTEYETEYSFTLSLADGKHTVLDMRCTLEQRIEKTTDAGVFFTLPEFDQEDLTFCTQYFRKQKGVGVKELKQILQAFLTEFCSEDIAGFLSLDFEQPGCCGPFRDASPPRD